MVWAGLTIFCKRSGSSGDTYLHIAIKTAMFGSFANHLDSPDELACCKEDGVQQHFFRNKNVLRKPPRIEHPIVIVRLIGEGQHQSIF